MHASLRGLSPTHATNTQLKQTPKRMFTPVGAATPKQSLPSMLGEPSDY